MQFLIQTNIHQGYYREFHFEQFREHLWRYSLWLKCQASHFKLTIMKVLKSALALSSL